MDCKLCGKSFPTRTRIDGKMKTLAHRKYCLECSPYGCKNGKKLKHPVGSDQDKADRKEKHRLKCRKWQRKARKARKEKLISMLGGKCSRCGYSKCIKALDFHHENKDKKSFGIATFGLCNSMDKLVEEVKKCILLCKNCHTELHDKEEADRIENE